MKVLVLGRTNVGKSSLFNRLIQKRKSLVINESGITRDILKDKACWWGHDFEVIDSGGLPEQRSQDELSLQILEKIQSALQQADIFIVVVDAKTGLHFEDKRLMKRVRQTGKPFLLFVNKVDKPENTLLLTLPFYELSPHFLSGSLENNYGVHEIVEWILSHKQRVTQNITSSHKGPLTKLFVIGRANSGKSLLCNQILQNDRMIVSSQAGTTLDTVTEFFSYNTKDYSISDNPGSRRGNPTKKEKISFAKSRSELEKTDIVLLVMDAKIGPSRQEARFVKLCLEQRKPVILVVNKMDLLKSSLGERGEIQEKMKQTFHFYSDLPIVFMSAKTGYHKNLLFKRIESLRQKINFRITTSELNHFFTQVIKKAPAPVYGTSDVKFYYINQTNRRPPEFIAFVNYPKGVTPAYHRFIVNRMKAKWNLKGIPVNFCALSKR